jgi:hypothetical protein
MWHFSENADPSANQDLLAFGIAGILAVKRVAKAIWKTPSAQVILLQSTPTSSGANRNDDLFRL